MEHGLYVLEGKAAYLPESETGSRSRPGTYMWLRAFCPQACYAAGPGPVSATCSIRTSTATCP